MERNDEKGKEVVYIELVPGFNQLHTIKKYPRSTKTGRPYTLYEKDKKYESKDYDYMAVYTPYYSNLIHIDAIELLKKSGRMPKDIQRENMFGFGVFNGDDICLIDEFRVNSFNINAESVKYNREYFLTQYYAAPNVNLHDLSKKQIVDKKQGFKLQRPLPVDLSENLLQALIKQLSSKNPSSFPGCRNNLAIYQRESAPSEKWWEENKNNKKMKNKALMNTLFTCIRIETVEEKRNNIVKDILHYIHVNQNEAQANILDTPFHYIKLLKNQIQGQPLHAYDTCLTLAAKNGQIQVVKDLLNAGANCEIQNSNGMNALFIAIKENNAPLIKILIEHIKVERTKKLLFAGPYGITPVLFAASQGNIAAMKTLIELKVDVDSSTKAGKTIATISDEKGNTPIALAALKGDLDLIKLLVTKGTSLTHPNPEGNSPLVLAALKGHYAVIQFALEQANLLIKTPAEYSSQSDAFADEFEKTLMIAVSEGHNDIARTLLDNRVYSKIILSKALLSAVKKGHSTIVKYLLEKDVD